MKKLLSLIGVFGTLLGGTSVSAETESIHETLTHALEKQYHLDYPRERVVVVNAVTLSDAPYTAVVYDIPTYNTGVPLVKWTTRDVRFYNQKNDSLVPINKVSSKEARAFYNEYQPGIHTRIHLQTVFFGLVILVPVLFFLLQRRKRNKVIHRADI